MRRILCAAVIALVLPPPSPDGQTTAVDFARDVQPIFRQHCIGCHGPAQQMNAFRLDRRRDAMKGGTIAQIGPGNSEGSRLYHRLVGNTYGPQMPPTGALSAQQIATIKAWIDQGAVWPDELAGEAPPTVADARATRMMEALRDGDRTAFSSSLAADPAVGNRRGDGGSTPLMFAALYGDAADLRRLLDAGADPNMTNDAGATAVMWAVPNLEKVRLLVERGANVNARSADSRTPLLIAASWHGSLATVSFLLDRGANPSEQGFAGSTPLGEAAYAGDAAVFQRLVQAGADLKGAGPFALALAVEYCPACVDPLLKAMDPQSLTAATVLMAPPIGDAQAVGAFVRRGADPAATDAGRSLLMLAASSDAVPVETIRTLLARGVDVNQRSPRGETALGLARLRGQTAVVDLLQAAGASESAPAAAPARAGKPAPSARAAVLRSLPLLQQNDVMFLRKAGCVSCHNNTLTAMTVAIARRQGLPVDETVARTQLTRIAAYLDGWRERALQGIGIPGDHDTVSYILLGLAAETHQPDATTDAMARYLLGRQGADGRWGMLVHRPPIESNDIEVTAASMRSLQIYAPKRQRAEYEAAVARAAAWLRTARAQTTEERAFRLLGLHWAGASRSALDQAARELMAAQRPDGGWSQIPSLESDAYATGQALVALKESGAAAAAEAAYARGVRFLVDTQREDGSWLVRTRALPIQPFFESGFPHGRDQFISAAATNWAAMALAYASR